MSKAPPNKRAASLRATIAERITHGNLSLEDLQAATGIHRVKLGRMRSGDCDVTIEEANLVYRALTASQSSD